MPIFLAFTLLFAVYLHYQMRKVDKGTKAEESLLEKEARANFTRRADISQLDFLSIPYERLPMGKPLPILDNEVQEEILSCQRLILSMKEWKILNLTGISNTELKLKYGVANLPFLMQYDENFSKLSRTLAKWGKLLYEAEDFSACKQVLEFAVSIKCDIEDIFITLGKIYKFENNFSALSSLKTQLDCFDEVRKANLFQKLSNL